MNYIEWQKACKEGWAPRKYDNLCRAEQRSLKDNPDPNATVRHHLRDTEEQRKYNDEHYELWGHNLDGTFEYGKYVIFVTEEWHNNYHKDSDETRQKKSVASKKKWEDPEYRKSQTAAFIKMWGEDDRRQKRSDTYKGEGNPFYGKHHSEETLEKLSGENNGMFGKQHTEESRKKMSDSRMGHVVTEETRARISTSNMGHEVSDETREKISIANTGKQHTEEFKLYLSEKNTGKGNPFYGKHHTDETRAKLSGENNGMYGKHHSEEARKAISEANKNKVVSEETRKKLSLKSSGENNGMYGKHHSEEVLNKIRNSTAVELQRKASIAYRKYKENENGDMKWQDFRREFMKEHK